MDTLRAATRRALWRILRPLARFCLEHGVSAPELNELMKSAFVTEGQARLKRLGETQTKSRLAVMSGLTRPDVSRLWNWQPDDETAARSRVNYGQRLIAAWLREGEYRDAAGQPAPLPLSGPDSFDSLVAQHGANMPAKAVLSDLLARGLVEERDGQVHLLSPSYIPRGPSAEKLMLMATDAAGLLGTLEHNLRGDAPPRFERKVSFRHLSPEGVELLQKAAATQGQSLLEELDRKLAPHARDRAKPGTAHAGLGIFFYLDTDQDD